MRTDNQMQEILNIHQKTDLPGCDNMRYEWAQQLFAFELEIKHSRYNTPICIQFICSTLGGDKYLFISFCFISQIS